MGWSCSAAAMRRLNGWGEDCYHQHGGESSQNSYTGADGRKYFLEVSKIEHWDGAITGQVFLTSGKRAGAFRIEADGRVSRKPTAWPFTS